MGVVVGVGLDVGVGRVVGNMTAVGGITEVGVGSVAVSPMTTTTFLSRFILTVAMVSLPVSTPPHAIWWPPISG